MKGSAPEFHRTYQAPHTSQHFGRRISGKGQEDNLGRIDTVLGNEPGNASGNGSCFSTAGRCQDSLGLKGIGRNDRMLFGIQGHGSVGKVNVHSIKISSQVFYKKDVKRV
jgi:hypothetical protein